MTTVTMPDVLGYITGAPIIRDADKRRLDEFLTNHPRQHTLIGGPARERNVAVLHGIIPALRMLSPDDLVPPGGGRPLDEWEKRLCDELGIERHREFVLPNHLTRIFNPREKRDARATDWVILDHEPDPNDLCAVHACGRVRVNGTVLDLDPDAPIEVYGQRTGGTLVGVSVPTDSIVRGDFGRSGNAIDTIAGVPVFTPAPDDEVHQPEEYVGPEGPDGEPGRSWTRVWVFARSIRFTYPEES